MRLTFTQDPHAYALDGVPLPSVTQVLAPLIDFSHLPVFVRQAALERGRLVHDAITADNTHDLDEAAFVRACPDEAPYLTAWRSFRDERRFVPVLNEYRVASPRHKVAGTLDCLGLLDGQAALIDFKTGDPRDVAADLQTAAYVTLALEWAKDGNDDVLEEFFARWPVVRRYAIQLRRDATFRVEAYTNHTDYRDFLLLASAHHVVAARRRTPIEEAA